MSYIEITNIKNILSEIDKNTLVVFDLDYTLFRNKDNFGSPEWYHYLVENQIKEGLDQQTSMIKWYPVWLKAQTLAELELMDPEIPALLKTLENQSAGFIGLTARCPWSAAVTHQQLNKLGLSLNKTVVSKLNFNFDFAHPVVLEKGIMFVQELNDKGQVFAAWFEKVNFYLGDKPLIKKIVYIDDVEAHVVSMSAAVKELNLEFCGYYYSAAAEFKKNMNAKLVMKQGEILLDDYSEEETQLYLKEALSNLEKLETSGSY